MAQPADPAAHASAPMLSVAEALDRVLTLTAPTGIETIPLNEAVDRVLRADLTAARTQPPFAASAMDGYAVRATEAMCGARLRVAGEIAAGQTPPRPIAPGETMRIFTGAPMPDGADAVVLQEDARRDDALILVGEAAIPGGWVRPAGGDFGEGEILIRAPRRLSPEDIGLAAAMGRPWLAVSRPPRVALLPFGDELRLPGEPIAPGQILSSNNFGVAALARQCGAETTLFPVVPDDLAATRAALRAAAGFDVIVTLGGASDGDHDLSRPAFAAEGMAPDFYRIAMRPGKPLMAGRFGQALALGLPGNPVSAMICARLFLVPALIAAQGLAPTPPRLILRPLAIPLEPNGPREHYMRAVLRCADDADKGQTVAPVDSQDSSLLSRLSAADTLIVRPPQDPARVAGEQVRCLDLRTSIR